MHAKEFRGKVSAKTSRYYPAGTLAAHVLGFTGSDSQGLYGLEYYYDEIGRAHV